MFNHVRASVGALAAVLAVVAIGCGGDDGSSSGSAGGGSGDTASLEGKTLRIAFPSEGPDDLPVWPAIESLEAQGVKVEIKKFAEQEATISAMVKGDVDVTVNLATPTVVAAVEQGAPVKMFTGYTRNSMVLASNATLSDPSALNGKAVGVHSETSLTKALAETFLQKNGLKAEIQYVEGSDVRAQALSKNQLEAAVVSLTDFATLQAQYSDKFKIIVDFTEEHPDLMAFNSTASDKWLQENPELASAFAKALVEGSRKVADKAEAMKYAEEHYKNFAPSPEILETQVTLLTEGGYFTDDLQLTDEVCKSSIEFLIEAEQIEGLESVEDPKKYCNSQILQDALGAL